MVASKASLPKVTAERRSPDPLREVRLDLKHRARTVRLYQDKQAFSVKGQRTRTDRSFLFEHPLLTAQGEEFLFRLLGYYRERQQWHLSQSEKARLARHKLRHQQAVEAATRMIAQTRELLVQSNLRLASAAARKYANERLSFDDLFSDASMILLKAIDLFDPNRGFRFSTYFVNAAMRHLHKVRLRSSNSRLDVISIEPEYLAQLATFEFVEECERREEKAVGSAYDQAARKLLPERHYFVMSTRCGLDGSNHKHSFESIGHDLGVSKERARQLFHEAIARLRTELIPDNR